MVVEIDASGWKDRTVTDDNGFYYFHGLSWGRALLNLVLEDGGLPTNPNAVVSLTGHNEVRVDLGFFPPASASAAEMGAVEPPVGSEEASAPSGMEASQGQEEVAASAAAGDETAQPTAEARLSDTLPEAEQPVNERMPVTGRAAGSDYDGRLLLGGAALGALILLGRRAARSLRR